jgi:uncharacterized protein DUF1837
VPVEFTLAENQNVGSHAYRVHEATPTTEWLESVAREYVSLRTSTAVPLTEVSLDGIDVLSVDRLRTRIAQAAVPPHKGGPLSVVRSDFGEILLYCLLEQSHGTAIGYKSIRDRELPQQPGRGIDAVGVEQDTAGVITLVLGEAKVSDEDRCPPRVVEGASDSLREQHRGHVADRTATASKVLHSARMVTNEQLRDHLIAASLLLEEGRWDRLRVVACCLLVRSAARFAAGDYGRFRTAPADFSPAEIRFLVVRLAKGVDETVGEWHETVKRVGSAA